MLDLKPVFNSNTEVEVLSIDQKELFEVFRVVVIEECKILVIIDGLDNIDIVSRRKLMKWLLKHKTINILIETTNVREMIELYPKQYIFEGLTLKLQFERDESEKDLYLKRLDTVRDHELKSVRSSFTEQKDEK
jgi:ABC-type lipopolysaccharide export system ATPase subunit